MPNCKRLTHLLVKRSLPLASMCARHRFLIKSSSLASEPLSQNSKCFRPKRCNDGHTRRRHDSQAGPQLCLSRALQKSECAPPNSGSLYWSALSITFMINESVRSFTVFGCGVSGYKLKLTLCISRAPCIGDMRALEWRHGSVAATASALRDDW